MKWLGILWFFSSVFSPPVEEQFDPCRVFGSIYIEEYPENAQFLVYEEASEAFATLQVFEEDNYMLIKAGNGILPIIGTSLLIQSIS